MSETGDQWRVVPGETPLHFSGGPVQRDQYGRMVYQGTFRRDEHGKCWIVRPEQRWGGNVMLAIVAPELDLSKIQNGWEVEVTGTGCSVMVGTAGDGQVWSPAILASRIEWTEPPSAKE